MKKILFILSCIALLYSCDNLPRNDSKICTSIFISFNAHIEGSKLDSFYTIRLSNQDTIREESYDERYPILTDRYQDKLANSQDSFHFVGLINDSIVIVEPYVFNADDCHIYKISGKDKIKL